jgi:hypothetical protein
MRTLEKLLLLMIVAYGAVIFLFNVAQNRALLDLSVPVMAGVLFVLWIFFGRPQGQH